MFELKNEFKYVLFFICITGVICISFNATIKLLKQSTFVSFIETAFDDLEEEEDETEKKEIEGITKVIPDFESLDFLFSPYNILSLNPIEAKLVSMIKNIQSPPPKI